MQEICPSATALHHLEASRLKATVENPRGSVEKMSPKENVKGSNTVLRGSVRAPEAEHLGWRE